MHMMLFTLKRVTIVVVVVYCLLTCYTAYILLVKNSRKTRRTTSQEILPVQDDEEWNPWGEEFENEHRPNSVSREKPRIKWWGNHSLNFGQQFHKVAEEKGDENALNVEIWGKAAIGLYLWEHILNGKLEKKLDGIWSYGFRKFDNIKFKFRTGPGVIPTKIPPDVENVVLVLNGRSDDKVAFARIWLDFLPRLPKLQNVALMLLGNEECRNDWVLPYMSSRGGHVNFTFIVYDSPLVDNTSFYQWPLGVATYRQFPKPDPKSLELEVSRPYVCNFLGTVYPHSSRQKLVQIIDQYNLSRYCFIKTRKEWQPQETKDSLETYVQSLRLSDLTLSPIGMNSECYRIYEALSFGSVPVVEDVVSAGKCANPRSIGPGGVTSPLRQLKAMNAPLIYVKDWAELPVIIERELSMSKAEKVARRMKVVEWYENFKAQLRDHFVNVIKQNFFKSRSR